VFMHEDFTEIDTGSLRGDYAAIAAQVRSSAGRVGAATFAPRLLGEAVNDPELHAIFYENLVQPRRDALGGILRKAVERGELRDDVDVEMVASMVDWLMERFQDALVTEELDPGLFHRHANQPQRTQSRISEFVEIVRSAIGAPEAARAAKRSAN